MGWKELGTDSKCFNELFKLITQVLCYMLILTFLTSKRDLKTFASL